MSMPTSPMPTFIPTMPKKRRRLPTWALVLIATGTLVIGLLAGGVIGHVSRNGEVRDIERTLSETRDDLAESRDEIKDVQAGLDASQANAEGLNDRIDACELALDDLEADMLILANAMSDSLDGYYVSAANQLEDIDAAESPEATECRNGGSNA